jgi:hypothetical protein
MSSLSVEALLTGWRKLLPPAPARKTWDSALK